MCDFSLILIRKNRGYSQQCAAREIGISRQYYNYIERGIRLPPIKTAKKIAAVLNFDWRLFFEDNETTKTRKDVNHERIKGMGRPPMAARST